MSRVIPIPVISRRMRLAPTCQAATVDLVMRISIASGAQNGIRLRTVVSAPLGEPAVGCPDRTGPSSAGR
jgi:hypothetical protein